MFPLLLQTIISKQMRPRRLRGAVVELKPDLDDPTGLLQCFDTDVWVIWPAKTVREIPIVFDVGGIRPGWASGGAAQT